MRSRYSAFVVGDSDYLLRTWDPTTRPESLELDDDTRWFGLEILDRSGGGMLDTRGIVEFRAKFRADGVASEQRERSRFRRDAHRHWLYVDAI